MGMGNPFPIVLGMFSILPIGGRGVNEWGSLISLWVSLISYKDKMKQKIDSLRDRMIYSRRLGTVEPPFGNLRYHKGLDRFMLRGGKKVDGQWRLYALVHNIEKLAHYGAIG